MYKNHLFKITNITNLHVGSGEQYFGIIDNLVQRDPITEIPVINASSLKGSLRDHFYQNEIRPNSNKKDVLSKIFGSNEGSGEVKIFQADLVALPVRSSNKQYYLATTFEILKQLKETSSHLSIDLSSLNSENNITISDNTAYISDSASDHYIEDFKTENLEIDESIKTFLGFDDIAIFSEKTFKSIVRSLPIITRNKIAKNKDDDNNLFYEEIIPRRSIFSTFISLPTHINKQDEEKYIVDGFDEFIKKLDQSLVQIGANASIGYGLCKFQLQGESK